MAIIEADGMFNGDRLASCSNMARLYWPYFYTGSNSYGRIELNLKRIISRCFYSFKPQPTEKELAGYIKEYSDNYLLFIYKADGQLWGQWDTPSKCLPRHHTTKDRQSPEPPKDAFDSWKKDYTKKCSQILADFVNVPHISENFGNVQKPTETCGELVLGVGVGVGVGVGEGKGEKISVEPSGSPLVCTLPLNDGSDFEVHKSDVETWSPLYPAVDVKQELRSMKGWLLSHPQNRKTRRGVLKFITGWLEREQDKAKTERIPAESVIGMLRDSVPDEPEQDKATYDFAKRKLAEPNCDPHTRGTWEPYVRHYEATHPEVSQ